MGSVLSRLFCGCCKYNRESTSVSRSHSNEGNDKHIEFTKLACPPTPASDNAHVETNMDLACTHNGVTGACGFDDKWESSQLEQKNRFLSNTTLENKTNINLVTVKSAISSSGSQIAIPDVAKVISHDKCQGEDTNVVTIGSHNRNINSTDIEGVNRKSQNVSYLTVSIDIATM